MKTLAALIAAILISTPAYAVTTYKIFGLPDGTALQAGDGIEVSRGGNGSYHITGTELFNSVYSNAPGTPGQIVFNSGGSLTTGSPSAIRSMLQLAPVATTGLSSSLTNDLGFITAAGAPVQSVNGQTGAVTLSIPAAQVNSDWSASSGPAQILNKPSIPATTSQLTNNSGFITASGAPVQSVFGRTGTITTQTGDYTVSQITGAAPAASPTFTGTITATALNTAGAVVNSSGGQLSSVPTLPVSLGGTGQVSLAFNDATQATANLSAIQTALTAGGQVTINCPASTPVFYTNGHATIGSNTHLTLGANCIWRQASGANDAILTNYSQTQPWTTVWDNSGSITNGPLNISPLPTTRINSTGYVKGSEVFSAGNVYWQSATSCTTGTTGLSGTGTGIADGTCLWNYVTAETIPNTNSQYTSSTRSTYYALVHYPNHGLSVGSFVFITPQPDSNGYLWTGTGSAGQLGGPADSAYFGVFYVPYVNDSNYITVELRRAPSASFTGIPINIKKADDNIIVDGGGTLDYNYSQNPSGATQQQDDTAVLWGVHNLIINNLNSVNSFKYAFNIGGVYAADIGHVQGGPGWTQNSGVNGDQVHVYGPAFDVTVHDVNGTGYDDSVVFSTSENVGNNNFQQISGVGDIYKATARNITGYGGQRLGIFQSQAAGLVTVDNVILDNIETYSQRIVYPMILFGGSGPFNDITVENSTLKNSGAAFANVGSNAGGVGITMNRLVFLNDHVTQANSGFLTLTNATAAPITIDALSIAHSTLANSSGSISGLITATVTSGVALTVDNTTVEDVAMVNAGNLLTDNTGASFYHVTVDDSNIEQTTGSLFNGIGGGDFTLSNSRVSGGYVFFNNMATSSTLRLINNQIGSSAYVVYDGNNLPVVTLYSSGTNTINGGWFKYGGTAPLTTIYGTDVSCTPAILTSTAGQFCNSGGTIYYKSSVSSGASLSAAGIVTPPTPLAGTAPAIVASNGVQTITLSGNTAPTVSGIAVGQRITFDICQPATGGPYTWTWPAAFHGGMTIGTAANTCSDQAFNSTNGTTFKAESGGITGLAP